MNSARQTNNSLSANLFAESSSTSVRNSNEPLEPCSAMSLPLPLLESWPESHLVPSGSSPASLNLAPSVPDPGFMAAVISAVKSALANNRMAVSSPAEAEPSLATNNPPLSSSSGVVAAQLPDLVVPASDGSTIANMARSPLLHQPFVMGPGFPLSGPKRSTEPSPESMWS